MSAPRPGGFCTQCGHMVESFEGLTGCPACGDVGVPCAWEDQVTVEVNWQELRVLTIWAENWAREMRGQETRTDMPKALYAIAARLQAQHPGRLPLTLAGELGQVAEQYDMQVTDPRLRQDIAEQTGREVGLYRPKDDEDGEP